MTDEPKKDIGASTVTRALKYAQSQPTGAGILQGLITGWLVARFSQKLGLTPDAASVLAGGTVSYVTSLLHKLNEKLGLEMH